MQVQIYLWDMYGTWFFFKKKFLEPAHHLKLFLLEYNCFIMLCYFLLYNEVNQLYVNM